MLTYLGVASSTSTSQDAQPNLSDGVSVAPASTVKLTHPYFLDYDHNQLFCGVMMAEIFCVQCWA